MMKLLKINPCKDFESESELLQHANISELVNYKIKLFNLPVIYVLFDSNKNLNLPISLFLLKFALWGNSTQGDTVRTYAESLLDWAKYVESNSLSIETVSELDLQLYRNNLLKYSDSRKVRYSSKTVALRISCVIGFYRWTTYKNIFESSLGSWLINDVSSTTKMGRNGFKNNYSKGLVPKSESKIPRILSKSELSLLITKSEKPYNLIFKWAVCGGLRRFEICELLLSDLPKINQLESINHKIVDIDLKRKGGRNRNVYIPTELIEETNWYVLTDRPQPKKGSENFVFLSTNGYQIQKNKLSQKFRNIADEIGIRSTFHHLRHTFAVHTLQILQRNAEAGLPLNPLKTLQVLLGHSSIETSEIYLRALDIQTDAVEEALSYLYGATL